MGFIYFSFSTYFCFMAFCVFMTRFFVSSKILILACSSAMIHGSKNVYFQKQMFSSTSWMYYYKNYTIEFTRKNLSVFNFSIEITQHAFLLRIFFNRVRYFFPCIIPNSLQSSLMNLALGLLCCGLRGDVFLVWIHTRLHLRNHARHENVSLRDLNSFISVSVCISNRKQLIV